MNTYELCVKVIEANKAKLTEEEFKTYSQSMTTKLAVFLLADPSINEENYKELMDMLDLPEEVAEETTTDAAEETIADQTITE
ncbi:MAG: hypothetical protein ACERKN_07030 [Velocimicrobium sp.]